MSGAAVRHEVTGRKERYVIDTPHGEAELTLSRLSPGLVIADHTGVPGAAEGQGIGRALVDALIADARATGFKIVPLCPYVNAQRRRHPDWADLFQV
ncbi:MAG: GNAT family N-acetyltransferase [Paracoccaceae bacterium]